MPSWNDVPDDIKKRFPAPPDRRTFATQEAYEEARAYWQSHVGRQVGIALQSHTSSLRKYMRHARMLVPKFSCETSSGWHIQWPKDSPAVIYADTQKGLIPLLAERLHQLGRVGNVGKHVSAENDCPTCR